MRVKTAGLLFLTLLTGALAFGEDLSAPAGRYIRQGQSIDLLGDVDTTGKANGNCLAYDLASGDWKPAACGSGGGSGASTLQVSLGGTQVSSPTVTVNFDSSTFSGSASPSTTANIGLKPSSATLQGNTFNAANKLLQLDSGGLIPNSLVDGSSVTKLGNSIALGSETTGNYVASLVAGQGVTVGAAGAGATPTVALNPPTLIGDQTWSDGSSTPVSWTWNVAGVDPSIEFGDNLVTFLTPISVPTVTAADGNIGDLNVNNLTAGAATVGGKAVAQYSDTLIAGTTVYYASGTINALNVTTINGATYPPAGSGGGGGFWIGTATSPLNLGNLYAIYGATNVVTSSFTLTGATETINGITYVHAPLASMGTGQKLLVYTVTAGRMVETISDVITNGITTTSTDTKSGGLLMQSTFTIPTTLMAAGTPDQIGELAFSSVAFSSTMGTIKTHDGVQVLNVVVTTNTPSDNDVPKYDAASGKVRWEPDAGSGGSGTPGGSQGYFQINDASAFAGVVEMQMSTTTRTITWSSATTHTNVSSDTYTNVNIVLAGTSALYSGSDPGTAGKVLTSHGAGTPPTWDTSPGSSGVSVYPATATARFPYGSDFSSMTISNRTGATDTPTNLKPFTVTEGTSSAGGYINQLTIGSTFWTSTFGTFHTKEQYLYSYFNDVPGITDSGRLMIYASTIPWGSNLGLTCPSGNCTVSRGGSDAWLQIVPGGGVSMYGNSSSFTMGTGFRIEGPTGEYVAVENFLPGYVSFHGSNPIMPAGGILLNGGDSVETNKDKIIFGDVESSAIRHRAQILSDVDTSPTFSLKFRASRRADLGSETGGVEPEDRMWFDDNCAGGDCATHLTDSLEIKKTYGAGELRFPDLDNSNSVILKSSDVVTATMTIVLPAGSLPTAGQALQVQSVNGSRVALEFATPSGGGGSMSPNATYYANIDPAAQQSGAINVASGTLTDFTSTRSTSTTLNVTTIQPIGGTGLKINVDDNGFQVTYPGSSNFLNVNRTVGITHSKPFSQQNVMLVGSGNQLRLGDSDDSNYVAFKSSPTVTYNTQYVLPSSTGAVNDVLSLAQKTTSGSDTVAYLAWVTPSAGGGSQNYDLAAATGTLADARLNSTVTLDAEWNTVAKIEAATSSDIITSTEGATLLHVSASNIDAGSLNDARLNSTVTLDTEWNTIAKIEAATSVNILTSTEMARPPKEYWWPASATLPLDVADSIASIGKSTGTNIDQLVVDFDPITDECRTVNFKVPSDVNVTSTVTFRTNWFSTGTVTNNVMWYAMHNGGVADGVNPDAALTTVAATASAAKGTAGQITATTWTLSVFTLGWAANEQVDMEFCRDANHASDTLTTDARATGFGVDIPRN